MAAACAPRLDVTDAPRAPSISQQKAFIVENAGILNRETKLAILSIVVMEIGANGVVMETGGTKEVVIDLDAVAASNEDVISHIYNIVTSRREALSHPAGTQASGAQAMRPNIQPLNRRE